MTGPIWVTDPAGNNNPFLIVQASKFVVVGKGADNKHWTVQLINDAGTESWHVTSFNPDASGGSGAGAVFGAAVDHNSNAWVLWQTTNPPRNILWKFAAKDGTSTSFTLPTLTGMNISGDAGATAFCQMAMDAGDLMSIAGTVSHTFPAPGGLTTVGQIITVDTGGFLNFTASVLPNSSPRDPQFASANMVGVAVTPKGGVVAGVQSAAFFDSGFTGDTNSSDIQAVSGGGLNQKWIATMEFVQRNLQCLSTDGLDRIVGNLQTKQSGHTQVESFIFAYNIDGSEAWQTSIAGAFTSSVATCIDGDKIGNVYISLSADGANSIKEYDPTGALILTTTHGDAANGVIYLAAAPTGVIGSSGGTTYSFFDGVAGTVTWSNTLPGSASVLGIGRQSWPAS